MFFLTIEQLKNDLATKLFFETQLVQILKFNKI